MDIKTVLAVSALLRVLLIAYGCYHDARHVVKYTDIDYQVFTEAATYVYEGESPYESPTYRYTPVLAWILLPNVHFHILWGKILFSFFDLLTGGLLYWILRGDGWSSTACTRAACLWLFNPVAFTVSTRGNAEAILASLVLGVILLLKRGNIFFAAVLYGLAVHMKIYPIVYSLPLYLYLGSHESLCDSSSFSLTFVKNFIKRLVPNKTQLAFVILSASTFITMSLICYWLYGHSFLHQTYLYHISRKDIRHNFSVYYLMFYLMAESDWLPILGVRLRRLLHVEGSSWTLTVTVFSDVSIYCTVLASLFLLNYYFVIAMLSLPSLV